MHVPLIIPITTALILEKIMMFAKTEYLDYISTSHIAANSFKNSDPVWGAFSKPRDLCTVESPIDRGSYTRVWSTTVEHRTLSTALEVKVLE